MFANAEQFAATRGSVERSLIPRASGWFGSVYENLDHVHEAAGEQQLSDLRQAADYYRRALEQWGRLDAGLREHFQAEIGNARKGLARCHDALAKHNGAL